MVPGWKGDSACAGAGWDRLNSTLGWIVRTLPRWFMRISIACGNYYTTVTTECPKSGLAVFCLVLFCLESMLLAFASHDCPTDGWHRNYAECMKTQKATFCTRHLDGVPQQTLMAAKGWGLTVERPERLSGVVWRFNLSITETAQLDIQVKPHCTETIPK